ncbi:MAG: hypothetical protein A2Y93_04710 [Chloroflexi bacterium RBG_13_68_17]|nr:MAG: hypothetical protein A2Y93_04710 [Chloroflexi bacterium RBG_13_68_17]
MEFLSAFAKAVLIPGSRGFLLVGLTGGVMLLLAGRRTQAWGKRWLAFLAGLYWILSLPVVSGGLVGLLSLGYAPIESAAQAEGAEAVVVLGGGAATLRALGAELSLLTTEAALRVLEAARVQQLIEARWVIASGGTTAEAGVVTPESLPLQEALIQVGVPGDRILLESDSHDTHEQALAVAALLQARGVDSFVLVTSPDHMRRAVLSFRGVGLDPIPSPAPIRSETLPAPVSTFLPTLRSLEESAGALREVLGLGYYALRGWL